MKYVKNASEHSAKRVNLRPKSREAAIVRPRAPLDANLRVSRYVRKHFYHILSTLLKIEDLRYVGLNVYFQNPFGKFKSGCSG